jgi:hypothetical protein
VKASETDLGKLLLLAAPYALPNMRLFRRPILNVRAEKGFHVRAGIPGQADFYAMTRGGGHIEIETKAATGRLEQAQKRWRVLCVEMAVPHLVLRARKDEAPSDTVQRWIQEIRNAANPVTVAGQAAKAGPT